MGRQRTINDAEFWRSPRIADRTQEDKASLLYLLTSPYSNIIGIYSIVPRIAAAEMGWTAEQLIATLKRLESIPLVRYDDSSGYVWVTNWWDHNSAKMAVATTLRAKTYAQIDEIPPQWRTEFLSDFLMRIPLSEPNTSGSKTSLRDLVAADMVSRGHRVSIPYRQPIDSVSVPDQQRTDRAGGNTTNNANPNSNNYNADPPLEFPALEASVQEQLATIVGRLPYKLRQDVLDEISAKVRSGTLRSPIRLAQHFADNPDSFVISDGLAVRHARAKRSSVQLELEKQAQMRDEELANIDAQLCGLNAEQFENKYGRLPPVLLQQLRARRARMEGGHSI